MSIKDKHEYDDIIDLPHHVSKRHPVMSLWDRAAQFSPFAALTGHGAAIKETERLTEDFAELDKDREEELNEQLLWIKENLHQMPEVEVTYFLPDEKKSGGAYVTVLGRVKKIDEYSHQIVFADERVIPMERLFSIEIKDILVSGK